MDYEHIYDWAAKRAGGRITVYGKTNQGTPRRVSNVDTITIEPMGRVIATDKDTTKYVLALAPFNQA